MAPTSWLPIAGGTYVGTPANPRYPVYTRGNAGEVYPDVVYPLTFSTAITRAEEAWLRAVVAAGFFRPGELVGQRSLSSGVFGGYAYLNLSFARVASSRIAGAGATDVDDTVFGLSDAPPYQPVRGDRSPVAALRIGRWIARSLFSAEQRGLRTHVVDERRVAAWIRSLPPVTTAPTPALRAQVQVGIELGAELFEHHIFVSHQAGIAASVVKLCRDALGDEGLGLRLLAGLGEVASAAPALALWDLGRTVAADAALAAHFDAGTADLWDRLRADPAAAPFTAAFSAFLDAFGSRGPNEWETAADVWATRPELALTLVDRMRVAPAERDPRRRLAELAADRAAARAELDRRAGRRVRLQAGVLLDCASPYLQGRELAKTTIVRAIHAVRLLLRELGARSAGAARAAGVREARPDDIWFVVEEELDAYLADPAAFAGRIAERRTVRERLCTRRPPFTFDGEPPPWEHWPLRDRAGAPGGAVGAPPNGGHRSDAAPAPLRPGEQLRGIGGAPGIARGRVRVVRHPADGGDLGPGEVLVAPITDPSWTPLFVPAAAVVVEVGALLSHAVIVARELGIPAVVSATGATVRLRDGDPVEVDGGAGTVTVVGEV